MYLAFALLMLILAVSMFRRAGKARKTAGLPGGRIIYTDTSAWGAVEKPLYDPVARLSGRPDYLVEDGDVTIPVEVKSGRVPDAPYDSHIYQLAAYCYLVEKTYGKRPPYGIIHYSGSGKRTFQIEYTQALENKLMELIGDIRRLGFAESVARSHEESARCRGCGFAYTCEQRL